MKFNIAPGTVFGNRYIYFLISYLLISCLLFNCTRGQTSFKYCPDVVSKISVPERLPNVRCIFADSPLEETIWDIEIVSSSDVWAVTQNGRILHFDGTSWALFANPTNKSIRGLCMLSSDEGWAVGLDIYDSSSILLHYENQNWTMQDKPVINDLSDVDFLNWNEGWAVGQGILHYSGGKWETFPTIKDLDLVRLWSIDMVSENEGWAVGSGGTILYYNGNNWNKVNSPVTTTLFSVEMCSTSDGWIVGDDGTILRYDGSEWNIIPSPTVSFLFGISVNKDGNVFVIGYGTLLYFDGTSWSDIDVQVETYLRDIEFGEDNSGIVVGDNGIILQIEMVDINVPPPNIPQIDQIENEDGDVYFTVSWERDTTNVKYALEQADESLCAKVIYFGEDTSKEIVTENVGRYYYRVKSVGVGGQSGWSMIKSVKVTTPPPPCSIECTGSWNPMGGAPSVSVKITCESGEHSSSMKSMRTWEDQKGWVTHFEETRTYKESGNKYKIVGSAYPYVSGDSPIKVGYEVEVTGGVFGDTPRTCSSK